MIRVLKCFVTPTLSYTAHVDESELHICFYYNYVIEYIFKLAFSVLLVIRVLKCFVTPTLTYTAQFDDIDLHVRFDSHWIIEYMR